MPKLKLSTLMLMLGLSVIASGCVDQEVSMTLRGNFAQTVAVDDGENPNFDECQYPKSIDDENARSSRQGFMDLEQLKTTGQPNSPIGRSNVFIFGAAVGNQLKNNEKENDIKIRVNTNDIVISGAEITYNFNSSSLQFTRSFSDVLDAEKTSSLLIDVPLIASAEDIRALSDCVRLELAEFQLTPDQEKLLQVPVFVDIKIIGETLDGEDVESHIFTYPVDICLGCGRRSTAACIPLKE